MVLAKALESPFDCKEIQSLLNETSPGCSLEGMMLKLKLQYFGHLIRRVDSLKKTLMLGGNVGRRRRGQQMVRWLDGSLTQWTWVWVNSGSWWWTGRPGVLQLWGRKESDMTEQLNWTELKIDSRELGFTTAFSSFSHGKLLSVSGFRLSKWED